MTIAKQNGEFVCTCNDCGKEYPGGCEDDFRAFVDTLKDAEWSIEKRDDTWTHYCPECSL